MIVKEAYKAFKEKYGTYLVNTVIEYTSCYVFEAVPNEKSKNNRVFDALYKVDKNTGKVSIFSPMDISLDEFEAGRKISEKEYV